MSNIIYALTKVNRALYKNLTSQAKYLLTGSARTEREASLVPDRICHNLVQCAGSSRNQKKGKAQLAQQRRTSFAVDRVERVVDRPSWRNRFHDRRAKCGRDALPKAMRRPRVNCLPCSKSYLVKIKSLYPLKGRTATSLLIA
jgi:hypothetical protein